MKKFIHSIWILCLYLQFTGCYSYSEISIDQLRSKLPDSDIKVSVTDSSYYEIQKGEYYINNDTLFAIGKYFQGDNFPLPVRDAIPLEKIKEVDSNSFSMALSAPVVLAGGALVLLIGYIIIFASL